MALPAITLRNTKGSALTFTEMDNNLTNLQTANIQITDGVTTSNIGLNEAIQFSTNTLNGSITGNVITYDINPQASISSSADGMIGVTYKNEDSANVSAVAGLMVLDSNNAPMLLWKTNPGYSSDTDDLVPSDAVLLNIGGDLHVGSGTGNLVLFAGGTMSGDQAVNVGADGVVRFASDIVATVNGEAIGYLNMPQVSAGNVTLALSDAGKHFYDTSTNPVTITIPNNANVAFATGTVISLVNHSTGNIIVGRQDAVSLFLGGNATSAGRTVTSYGVATLMKVATNTWFINGTGVV